MRTTALFVAVLVFIFSVAFCPVALAESLNTMAATRLTPDPEIIRSVPAKPVPVRGGAKSRRKSTPRRTRAELVPPPPPTIPSGVQVPYISGVPVELLSVADLKRHRDEVAAGLAKATREADEQQKDHKERSERAVLFESLYKEGVVSRRELENAQREVRQGEEDLTGARLKVTDMELDLKRTDERLKQISAQKRQRPASKKKT